MRNAHRCFRAAKQKRRKIDPKARSTAPGAPQAIGRRTKRLLERLCGGSKPFWMAPGRSWPARGVPRSALGRHLGAQRPSRACPDACPTRPGATTTAQDRYFVDLGCMFVDFRTIFRRFSFEPLATKAQIQNLKKESRDPHRTSWLLRFAVSSYCSHVFRNGLRTLHVQPFSLRTHKPT